MTHATLHDHGRPIVADYRDAMCDFARLHRELADLRERTALPEAAAPVDQMLRINAQTMEALKRGLTDCLSGMKRF